jgi:hypothetical protein
MDTQDRQTIKNKHEKWFQSIPLSMAKAAALRGIQHCRYFSVIESGDMMERNIRKSAAGKQVWPGPAIISCAIWRHILMDVFP